MVMRGRCHWHPPLQPIQTMQFDHMRHLKAPLNISGCIKAIFEIVFLLQALENILKRMVVRSGKKVFAHKITARKITDRKIIAHKIIARKIIARKIKSQIPKNTIYNKL